jgi:NAD(P)H-flavin reductase
MTSSLSQPASVEEIRQINALIPTEGRIINIIQETPDVKTFQISAKEGGLPFQLAPGQLLMISIFGVGEAIFSARVKGNCFEVTVKRVGVLTEALHEAAIGQTVGIRGPYGNGFPLDFCRGKDLLFVAGGIGLAPVRSLINYVLGHRAEFGHLELIYGSRTPRDLVFKEELLKTWTAAEDFNLTLTVDQGDKDWQGQVGLVPNLLKNHKPMSADVVCILCGPPVMIKFSLQALEEMDLLPENIITTLEMRMKCGIGKCGRCNIGACYVCLDGPVFSLKQLRALPNEF